MTEAHLSPSEAARLLGVSGKALRLYEERGFIRPLRDAAGWRHYGPAEMARLEQVVALRRLGLSLTQISRVLNGVGDGLAGALAEQQEQLERQIAGMRTAMEQVTLWRQELAQGRVPDLVGPLGSGKTRLAMAIATALGVAFHGLDRTAPETLSDAAAESFAWLVEDGATPSAPLRAVVAALHDGGPAVVLDLIENGLDEPTQLALGAWLQRQKADARPLVVMTRSSAILDLDAVSPGHAMLYCPANHSPPLKVLPVPGAAGYESLKSCLGTPEARARTNGMTVSIGTTAA